MFVSIEFCIFVGVVLALYNVFGGRLQNGLLLLASYLIYAYFDWRFLGLLIFSTAVTYLIARRMAVSAHPQRYLVGGLLFNLAILAVFKLAGFFAASVAAVFTRLGFAVDATTLNLVLPLGLSFYSFRLLSYLFDVQKKRIPPADSWIDFALYVAFFPQIVSGPIERASRFLPRLKVTRRLTLEQFLNGLTYLLIGLFYKAAIADPLSPITDKAFLSGKPLTPADALAAFVAISIRIYADFAGYSAMAIGVSLWFGLPAMDNFKQPYFARNLVDFWTRWHISLSTWLRDYLFFPLSRFLLRRFGSKRAFAIQVGSLFVTMIATGLWHGAALTFVVWGGLHGLYLAGEHALNRYLPSKAEHSWINDLGNILATQLLVSVAWIFFWSPSLPAALSFFQQLLTANYAIPGTWWPTVLTPALLLVVIDVVQARTQALTTFWQIGMVWRVGIVLFILLGLFIFAGAARATFIYASF